MDPLILFSSATFLFSTILSLWKTFEEANALRVKSNLEKLEIAQQLQLQREQQDHEIRTILLQDRLQQAREFQKQLLVDLKSQNPPVLINALNHLPQTYLERLTIEAEQLSDIGFDIVFEPVDEGFGFALELGDTTLIGFLLPFDYPNTEPLIFMTVDGNIERIRFGNGAWDDDIMLSHIVSVLKYSA